MEPDADQVNTNSQIAAGQPPAGAEHVEDKPASASRDPDQEHPLSPAEIKDALKLCKPDLIRAISRMAEKQYDETARHTSALDAKGGQLLGFIGATIALALSGGSGFIREAVLVQHGAGWWFKLYAMVAWCVWIASLGMAVWAMWYCCQAVRVRPFKALASRDILNKMAMRGHDQ